jgi:hypothetical protein
MKTTEEWFNQLPEDYRDKALKNMIDPSAQHYTLAGAVSNGFVWDSTPEGKDYWNGVFRELMYGEKFEPTLTIQTEDSIIESGLIEVKDTDKKNPSTTDTKPETILVETNSEETIEDKGGNTPDLLSKYKAQKSEIK